mgnify:CR=1 FL=1
MTRITNKQRATIVRLFAGGATMANLSASYGVSVEKIEQIVREYLPIQEVMR